MDVNHLQILSLGELLELDVVTASRKQQKLKDAPANITVITRQQIEQRAYTNLVQVLQDVAGFDFATYEDGGGEYSSHSSNRGIGGSPGNPKLLILLDGIVQNHISFNWSQLWGEENLFIDLERIEIVQGPGSASYGANAFSGVINFITYKGSKSEQTKVALDLAEHKSKRLSLLHQQEIGDLELSFAAKYLKSEGDMGLGRYDPGAYFHSNFWPNTSSHDYQDGQYIEGSVNPYAGQATDDGFNTKKDIWSLRGNLSYLAEENSDSAGFKNISLSWAFFDKKEGLGNYVPAYEYQASADNFHSHHASSLLAANFDYQFSPKLKSHSVLWYRDNKQKSDTGFRYTYRFVGLTKSYHSHSQQWGMEQQFTWQADDKKSFTFGGRVQSSDKMPQVVSLGQYQSSNDGSTDSSWSLATQGEAPELNLRQVIATKRVDEQALFVTYDQLFFKSWQYNLGLRYEHNSSYGTTLNPRLSLIYSVPSTFFDNFNVKLLYGEAFREPSIFELEDEFRGNKNLKPEQIATYEMVVQGSLSSDLSWLKESSFTFSSFLSELDDLIALTAGSNTGSGSRYTNTDSAKVLGVTAGSNFKFSSQLSAYFNYHFSQGNKSKGWHGIKNTASHKFNAGFNIDFDDYNIDLRLNHVGPRNVPDTNRYFVGKAPSYTKVNMALSSPELIFSQAIFKVKLIVHNVLDEQYYGLGRQDGSSLKSDYDIESNINPNGFIPAYHPQPGRRLELRIESRW